jgi:hypothetical protein
MMRAMVLEYQNDPNTHDIEDQYMFGDEFLVAPIVTAGTADVTVSNPAPGGGESNILTFAVRPTLDITITSPTDGETMNKAKIIVRGSINSSTKDVGITVNGLEHIDYLPVMDFRNNAISVDTGSVGKAIIAHTGLVYWNFYIEGIAGKLGNLPSPR